jgi:sterol 24-C-methyltransferase
MLGFIIDPVSKLFTFVITFMSQEKNQKGSLEGGKVDNSIDDYNKLHEANLETRESKYAKLVNAYYDLATIFYEWGWGQSFHFAIKKKGETFYSSLFRHEKFLSDTLGLKKGDKVLDCGCGVGGPYRTIAKHSGADITGVTINAYQVMKANEHNKAQGLQSQCRSQQADFMKLPFKDESFDAVYAIEATCHAPNRVGVYSEIMRVLKPGQKFVCYEWCLTDKYDKKDKDHQRIKKWIEEGDGLPDMALTTEVDKAIVEAGLILIESKDMALEENPGGDTWYEPLMPGMKYFTQMQFTAIGTKVMHYVLTALEFLKVAPAGTVKVQEMLQRGGRGCAEGGVTGIFTPMYMIIAQKPE